ncbi:COP23 domain-containing protein [Dendronalium sp. ChiSLP03b]|uniref:COP23 domain-containing protein n=1 Tax=Dendronalium sp. ChiSLP03b TaxID=3075381 RepID=UPI002AD48C86|nr:COP23 domain-containing protein [Dendronalium sp. ChiSLP03b]MDZ8207675.1 COP23 domain-containing protein [Dendronalium sp. ChiSLP03b]
MNNMNKWQSWVTIGTTPILALGAIAALSAPSTASNVQVTCKTNASTPMVIVTLVKDGTAKDYPILKFIPEYFSDADVVQNCQNAAKNLQVAYNTGDFKYLTTDKVNDRPVVCAIERRGIGCNHYSAQVLFSFKPTSNPSQALYEMLGSDFKQAQPPDVRTISRTYTDTKPFWWPF